MPQQTKTSRKPTSRSASPKAPGGKQPSADDIPVLEWIAAGVGLLLAATAVGFTAWDAIFGVVSPPSIEVRLMAVDPTPHGYVAQIKAINHGGSPASQVAIEGVLGDEKANATFDYIPEQSSATGGLIFKGDPRRGPLELRAKGFADAS